MVFCSIVVPTITFLAFIWVLWQVLVVVPQHEDMAPAR